MVLKEWTVTVSLFTDSDSDELEETDETGIIPFIPAGDTGQSRLQNEFEILKWLGKGGFGDVIKVSDANCSFHELVTLE